VGGYHGFATHTHTHTLTVATGKCREGVVANNIVQLIWIILICCSLSATPACTGARAATFSDIPPGTRILPTIEVPAPKTLERCQIHPSPTREAHCRSLHGTQWFRTGDYAHARVAFIEAYAIYPNAKTLNDLIRAEIMCAHHIDAARLIRVYLSKYRSSIDRVTRKRFTDILHRISNGVGAVRMRDARYELADIDGTPLPKDYPSSDAVELDPGMHTIGIKRSGRTTHHTVEVVAGKVSTIPQ